MLHSINTAELSAFPANENPYHHDAYHMGQDMGTNVTIMYPNHAHQECKYLIIINKKTGERMKVLFDDTPASEGSHIAAMINHANGIENSI